MSDSCGSVFFWNTFSIPLGFCQAFFEAALELIDNSCFSVNQPLTCRRIPDGSSGAIRGAQPWTSGSAKNCAPGSSPLALKSFICFRHGMILCNTFNGGGSWEKQR
jgi:hypothetical protein